MRALGRLVPLLALIAAAGCSEYHYYDINVKFNQASAGGFVGNDLGMIQAGVFTVSGADSGELRIGPNNRGLPLQPGFGTLGIVEFATFEDSGTLNFKFEAYCSNVTVATTKVGEGITSVAASAATTLSGEITVNKTGDFTGCQ